MAWMRQAVPFHRSANGRKTVLVKETPTAVQALAEVHDTPRKPLSDPLAGSGAGWMRHLVPFHASARGAPVLPLVCWRPTAVHAAGPPQETAISAPFAPIVVGNGVLGNGPSCAAGAVPVPLTPPTS